MWLVSKRNRRRLVVSALLCGRHVCRFFTKMPYSTEQRVALLEYYFERKSLDAVRAAFQHAYPTAPSPPNSTIMRLVHKFRASGSVANQPKKRSSTVLTGPKLNEIREKIEATPSTSTRRLAQQVHVSQTTVSRGLKRLHKYPYRVSMVQELKPPDYPRRVAFCDWFLRLIQGGRKMEVLDNFFFSDEAWFHLSGYVNARNYRQWSSEKPIDGYRETSLHPLKIGVWAAISRRRVIGPIFFENTIDGRRYREIITHFIALLEREERDCFFQQDGAPAHTARKTIEFLTDFFGERLVGRGLWPARSPEMTPPDCFLWGYLKNSIYETSPASIDELKERITAQIAQIDRKMLKRVFVNLVKRIRLCKSVNGGHFQHLL